MEPTESADLEHAHVQIKITLRKSDNAIRSVMVPASMEDAQTLVSWPSGGLHQSCHALLTETIRQEAFTMYLHRMTKGEQPETIDPQDLQDAVKHHLIEMLGNYVESGVADAKIRAEAIPKENRPQVENPEMPTSKPIMDPDALHTPEHKH